MKPDWRTFASSLRAVLFDLDGTLVDGYAAITGSVNHVRQRYRLPPLTAAEVRRFVGRGPDYLLEHTVPGGDPQADLPIYRAHYAATMTTGTELLPGARDVLAALKRLDLLIGVCSNKPALFTRPLLRHLQLASYLDTVLGPEDVARPKPAPDMVWTALSQFHVSAEQALYIGDMTVDIETARAAGVTVWVVPTGSDSRDALRAANPDRLLNDLRDVVWWDREGGE
ncbi:MAG: HAD family hydrolase [Gemmataceae bacterium]